MLQPSDGKAMGDGLGNSHGLIQTYLFEKWLIMGNWVIDHGLIMGKS